MGRSPLEEYNHRSAATGETIRVVLYSPSTVGDPVDHSQEVHLSLPDGRKMRAVFFPDPLRRGTHWFEDPTMAIVDTLNRDNVTAAVNDFIDRGVIDAAFEPIE